MSSMVNRVSFAICVAFIAFSIMISPCYAAPDINLPPDEVLVSVRYPSEECYYYVVLDGVPLGYHVSNGTYIGWCVDMDHFIYNGRTYRARMYSSYDPANPHPNDEDWDLINYILNHKQGTWEDVQDAIWYFVEGDTDMPSSEAARAMVNDALENGEGFVPGPGQVLAVVLYIDENTQTPIIEVAAPVENVVPQYPFGTVMGLVALVAAFGAFGFKSKIFRF